MKWPEIHKGYILGLNKTMKIHVMQLLYDRTAIKNFETIEDYPLMCILCVI